VASEVAASVQEHCFEDLKAPVGRVTRAYTHVPFSPPMEKRILINEEKLEQAVHGVLHVPSRA
jgi:pyruvate dehydrogenase E1 component beta subunit